MSAPLQIGLACVSARHPARFHRSLAGVFRRARREGAPDLETDRAGAERFRADADADHDIRRLPAARRDLRARRRSAPTTWSMTRRCWISCAGRPRARNTSPRSARDRWCWAPPACSRLPRGHALDARWTFSPQFGAMPTKTRVCVDRNRVTGGGVTAGIDFALTLVSIMIDRTDRGSDPARARIQSGAAVQCRLARHRAAGNSRDRSRSGSHRRKRGAATAVRSRRRRGWHDGCISIDTKKKAARFPETAFPVLRQLHIDGRFQNLSTGGLSPGHILIGSRCISGQSRTVARTDAMVSHLRKMSH